MQNLIKIYTGSGEINVKLLRLPKHIILPPVFSGVCDALCNMLYITAPFCFLLPICPWSMYVFSLPLWYQNKLLQNTKYNDHSYTVDVPLRLKLRRRRLLYGGGDHLEYLFNTKKEESVISGIALISDAQSQKIEKPNH